MLHPRPGQALETLHRISGAARFLPEGESGWLDLGDVEMHRPASEISRKLITRAARFGVEARTEETTSALFTWSIGLQEHIAATLEAQFLAARQGDADQPAYDAQSIDFPNVQRARFYHVGAFDIRNITVAVGTELFREGLDYEIDSITGDIEILEHGTIPPGATISVTFDAPVARYNAQSNGSARSRKLTRKGTLRLFEFDGGDTPRAVITFACALTPEEWRDRSTADFAKFTLRATQLGAADYRTRALPEPTRVKANTVLRWGQPLRRLGLLRADKGSVLIVR